MKREKHELDDGLCMPEVHDYAKIKYDLINYYADMFASSMSKKWECLVYIDLFAGAGKARIIENEDVVYSSAMISLQIKRKFNKYIFCDIDKERADSLQKRIEQNHPETDFEVVCADVNKVSRKLLDLIPAHSKSYKVLSFCFVDPFKMGNLDFRTIKNIADNKLLDFMVLIPAYMDANRNPENYFKADNNTVERFLGDPNWRTSWQEYKMKNNNLGAFITESFMKQMEKLDFINPGYEKVVCVRNPVNNSPLYDLVFFSRHPLGLKFWDNARKGTQDQMGLFD